MIKHNTKPKHEYQTNNLMDIPMISKLIITKKLYQYIDIFVCDQNAVFDTLILARRCFFSVSLKGMPDAMHLPHTITIFSAIFINQQERVKQQIFLLISIIQR